jgi:predicted phosphodiesterase
MRYGVIADVHANVHALDAALAFLSTHDLDGYLCAGDLVGYGPMPNECVRRVLALPGCCVAGNHDLIALGRLSDERCIPLAKASLRWTSGVLDEDVRALLADLPTGATVDDIALRHGSITDPQEYVVTEMQARSCLDELERVTPAASILVVGHTHRPMAVSRRRGVLLRSGLGEIDLPTDGSVLLNPGAVGQSRTADPRVRVMVLDTSARVASFHALDYDVAGCEQALRERGLPPGSCHLRRSRWADAAGLVTRHVRRLLQPRRSGRPLR